MDEGFDATLGSGVSVGHNAVLHGCTLEFDVLVGMNATVLNGAVIGSGSLVAAGAVVLEGTVVPPGSLVAGVPAKVRRELSDRERDGIRRNAASYLACRPTNRLHTNFPLSSHTLPATLFYLQFLGEHHDDAAGSAHVVSL